jgi:hypothetical protein
VLSEDELTRFLVSMGFGAMGAPNLAQGISRGGLFGLQSVDSLREQKGKQALIDAKLREEQQQEQQRAVALKQAQAWEAAMQGLSGAQAQQQGAAKAQTQSVVNAPDWASSSSNPYGQNATPSMRAKPVDQTAALQALSFQFPAQVKAIFEAQRAGEGKVYGEPQKDSSGRIFVNTDRGPRYIDGGFVPRDEIVETDIGGKKLFRTKYDVNPVAYADKTMSPAEADAARRGWATFNRGELRDAPVDGGGTQLGWVTPQGFNAVPGTATKPKDVPATIQEALATNAVSLTKIGRALELVDQHPEAFGFKNLAGDSVRQRTNPEGVDARAMVADIGSLKIHDRSGAAVTVSEAPRLTPFVPNVTDTPETIKKKLTNFQREYSQMVEELQKGYGINHVAGMTNKNVGTVRMGDVQGDPLAEARQRGLIK